MRKQLSFKKVVEAISEAFIELRNEGFIQTEEQFNIITSYTPFILDNIFNKITQYPKKKEVMFKELNDRLKINREECFHCIAPVRCPFHE